MREQPADPYQAVREYARLQPPTRKPPAAAHDLRACAPANARSCAPSGAVADFQNRGCRARDSAITQARLAPSTTTQITAAAGAPSTLSSRIALATKPLNGGRPALARP